MTGRCRGSRAAQAVLLLLVSFPLAGCVTNQRDEADNVARAVRSLPAVASAKVDYVSDFELGSNFHLDVELADGAGEQDAARLGEVFARSVRDEDLSSTTTTLTVGLPARDVPGGSGHSSAAVVELAPIASYSKPWPAPAQLSGDLRLWLRAARSPAARGVFFGQPTKSWSALNRDKELAITVDATTADEDVAALIATDPAYKDATWHSEPADKNLSPYTFFDVRGEFPDQKRRQIWEQIQEQAGGYSRHAQIVIDRITPWVYPADARFTGFSEKELSVIFPLAEKLASPLDVTVENTSGKRHFVLKT